MLSVCARRGVTHLVPTIDTELLMLAEQRDRFASAGVDVWVSDPKTITIAQSKRLTNRWLKERGFPTVDQLDLSSLPVGWDPPAELIAKPAGGSSSIGLRRVSSAHDVARLDSGLDYVLETIAHGEEFTVDVMVDREGRCRAAVPRQRLETRAGEVSKGRTATDPHLAGLAAAIAEALPGAYGVLNIQIFRTTDGRLTVIEINARLGGGFPLTWHAGCQMPLWLVQSGQGLTPSASLGWRGDQVMLRYDRGVYLDCRP
jgi:carbamoyl-phosphate synthase large subunit